MAMTVALVLLIGGRLLQLQGLEGTAYASEGEKQRLTQENLPAARGAILDRNGNRLAYSVEARTVYVDPSMVKQSDRVKVATVLAATFNLPYDQVLLKVAAKGRYSIIAKGVDPDVAEELKAKLQKAKLAGVADSIVQKRIYPADNVGAQVVGFMNSTGIGQGGIEQQFNSVLTGKDGKLIYESGNTANNYGVAIPAGVYKKTPAQPGATVQLTINQDLQYLTQSAVNQWQASLNVPEVQAVVLDVKTGQVLAMAATPGYNPNDPGATPEALNNPVISNVIEPGSVNKVTTFGPALNEGTIKTDSVLNVDGQIQVSDKLIKDAWVHGPISYTATGILAKSSNVGTIMVNEKLGGTLFYKYLKKFGIGEKTGIELPAESRGILAKYEDWSGSQKGNVPIGQGVSMTVLQMASIYQTIANNGVRIPPRIVESVTDIDGVAKKQTAPTSTTVLSKKAASELRYMLEAVVGKDGTAPTAAVSGYRVGGKTGTAQRPNPACNCYAGGGLYLTFAGIAPIENPRYVVAVAITDPTGNQHGGAVAGPLFSRIMGQVLQSTATVPSTTTRPDFVLTV